jgi:hypothetical protein
MSQPHVQAAIVLIAVETVRSRQKRLDFLNYTQDVRVVLPLTDESDESVGGLDVP